jgi:hypothetical protein
LPNVLVLGVNDVIARLPQSLRETCAVSFELAQRGIAARLGCHCHPIDPFEDLDSRFERQLMPKRSKMLFE